MKTLTLAILGIFCSIILNAQNALIPDESLKDMNGNWVSANEIFENGTLSVIYFANPSNSKCCDQIAGINEIWEESFQDKGVRLIVICIDNNGNWSNIKPLIQANNWNFEVYIDVNNNFKRNMCINLVPTSFLADNSNNVMYRNDGYHSDEEMLFNTRIEELTRPVKMKKQNDKEEALPIEMLPLSRYE